MYLQSPSCSKLSTIDFDAMLPPTWFPWAKCSCFDGPVIDVIPEFVCTKKRKLGDIVEVWSPSSQSWERGRIVAFRDAINYVEVHVEAEVSGPTQFAQLCVKGDQLRDPESGKSEKDPAVSVTAVTLVVDAA